MASPTSSTGFFRTLCWAVYLGCSWTWCIGMFLPVILVSEFGIGAWFVFAIPNVIGAAAMGWTLAMPGVSERIVAEHRDACVLFSAITFSFHLFFLFWLFHAGLMPASYAAAAVGLGFIFGLIWRKKIKLDFALAFLALCISVGVIGKGLSHPVFGVAHPIEIEHLRSALCGLAPVCIFGFLLCPYLDVTFHRARQETPPGMGKAAFGIGFGVVFLLMIVLTLMYSGDFALDKGPDDRFGSFGGALLISWVAMHIAAQTGFTFAAHLRALPRLRVKDWTTWAIAAVILWPAVITVLQTGWLKTRWWPTVIMLDGFFTYRIFMSFYGLVFPAYVWICMVPIRGRSPGRTRASITVTIIAVLLAMPMYWLGFIYEDWLWLIPGVLVVLLSRLMVRIPLNSSPEASHV
jgi:hypothetical protein